MLGWACSIGLVLWIMAREVEWRLTRARRFWRLRLIPCDGRLTLWFECGSRRDGIYCGEIRRLISLGRER